MLCVAMVLILFLIPSATASTEEKQTNLTKDKAQLKMQSMEVKLGEKGMEKVDDYLTLQASLPDVVKVMPYKALAFAATDTESQTIKMRYIDSFNISEEDKEKYKAGLQDIWNRYPEEITKDDYAFMSNLGPMIEKEALKECQQDVGIKWFATPHKDFAEYACDNSAYKDYAKEAADDPDDPLFEPLGFRYYNHYQDAQWDVGGAAGRCDDFAEVADIFDYNGKPVEAHQNFGFASHYISDTGLPFHSAGALNQTLDFVASLFNSYNHELYENYVNSQWNTGYEYGDYVSGNSQSITVNDPASAVKDNADHSAQYFDYIWNEMNNDPENFGTDIYVAYYTAQCVQETAKYNRGLYNYIM